MSNRELLPSGLPLPLPYGVNMHLLSIHFLPNSEVVGFSSGPHKKTTFQSVRKHFLGTSFILVSVLRTQYSKSKVELSMSNI